MGEQKTCSELIEERFLAREEQIKDMMAMTNGVFQENLDEKVEEFIEKVTVSSGEEPSDSEIERFIEEQYNNCEYTETSLEELALGVSSFKIVRIQLSTGGPADYIEVLLDQDGNFIKATYHYEDWFDGAEMNVPANSEMLEYVSWFLDLHSNQN
jgi:hypothetical protein